MVCLYVLVYLMVKGVVVDAKEANHQFKLIAFRELLDSRFENKKRLMQLLIILIPLNSAAIFAAFSGNITLIPYLIVAIAMFFINIIFFLLDFNYVYLIRYNLYQANNIHEQVLTNHETESEHNVFVKKLIAKGLNKKKIRSPLHENYLRRFLIGGLAVLWLAIAMAAATDRWSPITETTTEPVILPAPTNHFYIIEPVDSAVL